MTAILERYDGVLLDLDGVVYRGDQAIRQAVEALEEIRRRGVRVLFLTNNSSKTAGQVAEKLHGLGVRAEPEEVLTSGLATASMLRRQGCSGATAYVIGERGVRDALERAGIRVLDGAPDQADLVVVGWDRSVDYEKLKVASLLVRRGARLLATNADATYPAPDGMWPGAGSILAAVTTATGATPTVVGKPSRPLFDAAREAIQSERPLVVGDRIDTDVAGASAMGLDTLLVLSGVATRASLPPAEAIPTYVGANLSVVLEDIPPARFRRATLEDLPAIEGLLMGSGLAGAAPRERVEETLVLPLDNVGRGQDHRSEASSGSVAATARLEDEGGFGILRSVAVRQDLRGKGLGVLAVAAAVQDGRARGLDHVSLFTEAATAFFDSLGFRRVDPNALPEPVRSSRHAAEECAETAVAMTLDLS